jgi:hypothetical protein
MPHYLKRLYSISVFISFLINIIGPMPAYAVDGHDFVSLPKPGVMVHVSPEFNPPILKGIKVHPDNPFRFDFILDKGDSDKNNFELKSESSKLIKYFLASLTIPEKDLWVNLSPYEKDRIIPESFGVTEMGRDLLVQDYMLKQITASLVYPEDEIGKKFWKRVYEEAQAKYHTSNIPVSTFNKVWIVPEKAVVYENSKTGSAYIIESKFKVMLEQDYLALEKHEAVSVATQEKETNQIGSQIVREVVIPELTKEVNEGKNFSSLRQVYNSFILATWYKKKIKDSLLTQVYADKSKTQGININDPQEKEKIYQEYLKAFKKGVYNYVKEDVVIPGVSQPISKKYFSGGVLLKLDDRAMNATRMNSEAGLEFVSGKEDRIKNNPGTYIIGANAIQAGINKSGTTGQSAPRDRAMLSRLGMERNVGDINVVIATLQNNIEHYGKLLRQEIIETKVTNVNNFVRFRLDINKTEGDAQEEFIIHLIDSAISGKEDGYASKNTLLSELLRYYSPQEYLPKRNDEPERFADSFTIFGYLPNIAGQDLFERGGMIVPSQEQAQEMLRRFVQSLKLDIGLVNYDIHQSDAQQLWNEVVVRPEVQALGEMPQWLEILGRVLRFEDGRLQNFFINDHQLTREAKETLILKVLVLAKEGKSIEDIVSALKQWILNFKRSEAIYGVLGSGGWESEVHKSPSLRFPVEGLGYVYNTVLGMPVDLEGSDEDYIEYVGRPALSWEVQNEKIEALTKLGFIPLADSLGNPVVNDLQYNGLVPKELLSNIAKDRETLRESEPERWVAYTKNKRSIGLAPAESEYIDFTKMLLMVSPQRLEIWRNGHESLVIRSAISVSLPKPRYSPSSEPGAGRLQYPRGDVASLSSSDFRAQNHTMQVLHGLMIHYLMWKHQKIDHLSAKDKILVKSLAELFETFMKETDVILRKYGQTPRSLEFHYLSNDWGAKTEGHKKEMVKKVISLKNTPLTDDIRSHVQKIMAEADSLLISAANEAMINSKTNDPISDAKSISTTVQLRKTGGIDLTSNKVLQTQNAGEEIKFHLDPAQLAQLQNASGFTPVIINLQPMTNLRQFLGLDTKEPVAAELA